MLLATNNISCKALILAILVFLGLLSGLPPSISLEESLQIERTLYSNIYHYPNGTSRITVFNDFLNYFNGSEFVEINKTLVESEDPLYDYMVKQGIFETYFKSNPSTSETIKFYYNSSRKDEQPHKSGFVTVQPMSLNYRNDLDQLQQINMIQGVNGIPQENNLVYSNAFGEGLNISYSYLPSSLKETLTIANNLTLPSPQQYIIDGGNATLDLDFLLLFSDSVECYINGELWDRKTPTKGERIDFRYNGETIFFLPIAFAFEKLHLDEYEREIQRGKLLEYELKQSGNKFYVIIKTPYEWLMSNLTYPVKIDPSTEILRPEADGFYNEWSFSVPFALHWKCVDDVICDDETSYIATSGANENWERDLFIIPNVNLPLGSIITNLLINATARSVSDIWRGNFRIMLRTYATDKLGILRGNIPDVYTSYIDEWNVNPITNLNWTETEINNLEIGVGGSSKARFIPPYIWIYYAVKCTQVFAEITFIEAEVISNIPILFIGLLVFFAFAGLTLYLALKRKK